MALKHVHCCLFSSGLACSFSVVTVQFRPRMVFQCIQCCLFSLSMAFQCLSCCLFNSGLAWCSSVFTVVCSVQAKQSIPACLLFPVQFRPSMAFQCVHCTVACSDEAWSGIPARSLLPVQQPHSQALSPFPPLLSRRETLDEASHMIAFHKHVSIGVESTIILLISTRAKEKVLAKHTRAINSNVLKVKLHRGQMKYIFIWRIEIYHSDLN